MALVFLGIAIGVLVGLPITWVWSRRTERRVRELERGARSSERLAEQAKMTGGLAHEIKNPLSTIGLNVQLLQEDLSEIAGQVGEDSETGQQVGRVQRRLGSLGRETARLRDILEDFLRFAGRLELDRQQIDLNELLDELVVFFEPQATEHHIQIRAQLQAKPATLEADPALIKQAVLNLLINAVHAMADAKSADDPNGGACELIVRTQRNDSTMTIHITDTGPGIEPDVLHKIFQPYFSTKRSGTGLGLPTTRRIIEEHGGELTAHSEVGTGTDFVIELPL